MTMGMAIVGAAASVMTAIIMWLSGRGKNKADTASSLIATAMQMLSEAKAERDEAKAERGVCREENQELLAEVRSLKAQVWELGRKIDHLDEERTILLDRLAQWEPPK